MRRVSPSLSGLVIVLGGLAILMVGPRAVAQSHIAPTEAKSPAEELATFTVPPGFRVQLVAAEPQIDKPMQMAFDARGRLWVTTSRHYPFPANSDDQASDRIFILSDIDPVTGRAHHITTFADNLNIPIGILPLADGRSCLASSVGRIVKLSDTTGDGRADRMDNLYTGFGYRDTHGMTNSFTLLPDGWVYACHGFANDSTVRGRDGHTIMMNSGHTFRFRPDGSRIEIYTQGQVNPFGMTVDPWGNLYTADCHSKPITQLIRGAYYDSFGKPHDGLGYGPHVTRHSHGSTALCGLVWYHAHQFPPAYRDTMFLGNVVTNRINHDRIEWHGSTPVAVEQPDFLVSSDPWFRPVDIQLGPDGALYVADFYNRIIGHYEVDLKHPLRDKSRGRIWRIVYEHPSPDPAPASAKPGVSASAKPEAPEPTPVATSARADSRLAALRGLAEQPRLSAGDRLAVIAALRDDARLARVAVDVLTVHPHRDAIEPLIERMHQTPATDTHLLHAAKIALRNAIATVCADEQIPEDELREELRRRANRTTVEGDILDSAMLGVANRWAAEWFRERFQLHRLAPERLEAAARHVAHYGDEQLRLATARAILNQSDAAALLASWSGFQRGLDQARVTIVVPLDPDLPERLKRDARSTSESSVATAIQLLKLLKIDCTAEAFDVFRDSKRPPHLREMALSAVGAATPEIATRFREVLRDSRTPANLRDQLAQRVAASTAAEDRELTTELLATAPYRLGLVIAQTLASQPAGAERLFAAVKSGKASARLLQEKSVTDRLAAARVPDWPARVQALTHGLPSADARLAELVKSRAAAFTTGRWDAATGLQIYAMNCANCHQLGGKGGKVGPQLDGIGNRGHERLCEDILDPNRNIDHAFFTTQIDTVDGRVLTGLLLRSEGNTVVLADAHGNEIVLKTEEIEKRVTHPRSPMPADWGERLTPEQFGHLLAYLMEQRAK